MMKRSILFLLVTVLVCFAGQAMAQDLPESVQKQSRKQAVETEEWKKFDKSGKVKILQIQTTAPASLPNKGSLLDGSPGERLIEIKVEPTVQGNAVEWSFKNKGPGTVWILAAGKTEAALPVQLKKGETATLKTGLDKDRYTYIVVDNEGGKVTTFDIKAKCGGAPAKTTRGKSMRIVWF